MEAAWISTSDSGRQESATEVPATVDDLEGNGFLPTDLGECDPPLRSPDARPPHGRSAHEPRNVKSDWRVAEERIRPGRRPSPPGEPVSALIPMNQTHEPRLRAGSTSRYRDRQRPVPRRRAVTVGHDRRNCLRRGRAVERALAGARAARTTAMQRTAATIRGGHVAGSGELALSRCPMPVLASVPCVAPIRGTAVTSVFERVTTNAGEEEGPPGSAGDRPDRRQPRCREGVPRSGHDGRLPRVHQPRPAAAGAGLHLEGHVPEPPRARSISRQPWASSGLKPYRCRWCDGWHLGHRRRRVCTRTCCSARGGRALE